MCLFCVFHTSGIIKWAALSNCVFHLPWCSQSSHTLKHALSLHSILVLSSISLILHRIWFIIQQLVDVEVICTLWRWSLIIMLWMFVGELWGGRHVFTSLGYIASDGPEGAHGNSVWCSEEWLAFLSLPTSREWEFKQHMGLSVSMGLNWYLTVGFVGTSLISNDAEPLSHWLWVNCMLSLENSTQLLSAFWNWVIYSNLLATELWDLFSYFSY